MKKKTICFIGGHSGGHLYPLLTIASKKDFNKDEFDCLFFIPRIPVIINIIRQSKYSNNIYSCFSYPAPSKNIIKMVGCLVYTLYVIFFAFYKMLRERPKVIYSTGGYMSIPFAFVSLVLRIPFRLYHLDMVPGKASRIMSYFPIWQHYIYDETMVYIKNKKYMVKDQYLVRYSQEDIMQKEAAREYLKLDNSSFIILVLGGSQGSEQINFWMTEYFNDYNGCSVFVIHQSGLHDPKSIEEKYKKNNISHIVFDYKDDLKYYYNAADIVVARCGAGTLAELSYFGKSVLLVPLLGAASNHQLENAHMFVKKHSDGRIILEKYSLHRCLDEILLT
jgi:UDP-N-acetylglucosamine--N-acetylmuramyl-(pentapeptide) pyrophosphoryl-undecaprenol N-acetylglucosamine transferase